MKIFIVGAGGVASALCKCLTKERTISKVTCGSFDVDKAKEYIDTKPKKINLLNKRLDASNISQVAKEINGYDLVINASLPNHNESIMKAALASKANYQDLCSYMLDYKTIEQLKYHDRFRQAGLVGLINTGVSPGITNILAAEGKDKFEEVNEIKIFSIEEQKSRQLIFAWSPEVTLLELTVPPLAYKKGKFVLVKPFSDSEKYKFPDPIGEKYTVNIEGDEVGTLPFYMKVKNISYRACGTDIDFGEALSRLGFLSKKPVKIYREKIKPVDLFIKLAPPVPTPKEMIKLVKEGVIEDAIFMSVVEILGLQKKKKMILKNIVIYPDLTEIMKRMPGATYISYPTAVAAASFVKTIPQIKMRGVFPPEALSSKIRRDILIELEGYGIKVQQEFSRT